MTELPETPILKSNVSSPKTPILKSNVSSPKTPVLKSNVRSQDDEMTLDEQFLGGFPQSFSVEDSKERFPADWKKAAKRRSNFDDSFDSDFALLSAEIRQLQKEIARLSINQRCESSQLKNHLARAEHTTELSRVAGGAVVATMMFFMALLWMISLLK